MNLNTKNRATIKVIYLYSLGNPPFPLCEIKKNTTNMTGYSNVNGGIGKKQFKTKGLANTNIIITSIDIQYVFKILII